MVELVRQEHKGIANWEATFLAALVLKQGPVTVTDLQLRQLPRKYTLVLCIDHLTPGWTLKVEPG